jgi:hypothetical protein
MIEAYNDSQTIFDDPIVASFKKEFTEGLSFTDPEASTTPFSTDVILKLDAHLEAIETRIEEFRDDKNVGEIAEIKESANQIRNDLGRASKKEVFGRLAKLWAIMAKQGPKVIEEFLTEGGKVVVKETIKFLLGRGMDMIG